MPFQFKWERKTMILAGGAAGVAALSVVAFLLMRRKKKKTRAAEITGPAELPAGYGDTGDAALGGATIVEQQLESKLAERDAMQHKLDSQALNALKLAPVVPKTAEVLAKHLRERIAKEPDLSAQVLRAWIREEEA